MKYFIVSIILTVLFISSLYSQADADKDLERNRELAQCVIEKQFGDSLTSDYLLASMLKKYFLIIKKSEEKYIEYYLYIDSLSQVNLIIVDTIKPTKEEESLLEKLFDYDIYSKEYIDYQEFLRQTNQKNISCHGTSLYFYLANSLEKKVGETLIPCVIITDPIPIDIYI